jgi:hypothetical protein
MNLRYLDKNEQAKSARNASALAHHASVSFDKRIDGRQRQSDSSSSLNGGVSEMRQDAGMNVEQLSDQEFGDTIRFSAHASCVACYQLLCFLFCFPPTTHHQSDIVCISQHTFGSVSSFAFPCFFFQRPPLFRRLNLRCRSCACGGSRSTGSRSRRGFQLLRL